ncbi:uncharacterized protein PSFLO_00252 [Pseudozyma flocculosa]|uniref:BLUF domain-containing protein n=1 Tax=Pseudozyma flocculosa TaxID=84751 RepID=A0A5C3EUP7_9BASI|nr:uncharacterized protein PSFLO_00252 [Pseudozyma flocculosa]
MPSSVKTESTAASSVDAGTTASPVHEPVLQVVYTSSALTRHVSREEISDILQHSRRNNARRGITGLLLYRDGSFVQFLEGPAHEVDGVYQKIEADPRHRGIVRILRKTVEKRDFSKWEMAFRDLDLSRKRGHRQAKSAVSSASSTGDVRSREASSESVTDSEEEDLDSMRDGFSEVLNVGLRLGDQTDAELRADAYGSGKSKMDLPKDMSAQMRKLVTTFYKLMDRPL